MEKMKKSTYKYITSKKYFGNSCAGPCRTYIRMGDFQSPCECYVLQNVCLKTKDKKTVHNKVYFLDRIEIQQVSVPI